MLPNTTEIWITDKSEKKFFKTLCSTAFKDSELRNLQRKMQEAFQHPKLYGFIDLETMRIEEISA